MKRIKQQKKRGISLIVLVITIIVMIILAAAIILSLDGSNIIERAKGAQSSNDVATAKEIVALAKSEWSFERQEGYDTFREYAESKLEEAGFDMDNTYVEDSGRVLFDTAARFAKAGVQIGTEVQGYTLNNTKTYTTSGKENPIEEYDEEIERYVETDPQPATLKRDESITWKYMGIDENGEALIIGGATSAENTTPKMILGGKGGFLNGPQELNNACEAMYSSAKGTARSINIGDVTRVLEYKGERGAYYERVTYISTPKAKTINEIIKELGYSASSIQTTSPEEGKDIATYKSDFYKISKTNDASEYNSENKSAVNLIFQTSLKVDPTSTLTTSYWLASPSVYFMARANIVNFCMRIVYMDTVDSCGPLSNDDDSLNAREHAVRPVVKLAPDVKILSYDGTVVKLQ